MASQPLEDVHDRRLVRRQGVGVGLGSDTGPSKFAPPSECDSPSRWTRRRRREGTVGSSTAAWAGHQRGAGHATSDQTRSIGVAAAVMTASLPSQTTGKIHRRRGGGTVRTLALAGLIAACAGPTGTASTIPVPAGASPTAVAGSPVPAQTGTAIVALPAPTSAATGTSTGPALTTNFVGNEAKGPGEFGLTEAEISRRFDATEGLIGQCMTAAGFEYFPVDRATARAALDEFQKQFGFGITTRYAGSATQSTLSLGKRNDQYRAGLATADGVAYERALYGEHPDEPFVLALDQEDLSQVGGCTRAAVQLIFTKQLGASFVNSANLFEARVNADPRVIAANKDWSSCMRQAGYPYNNPGEIDADLVAKLDKLTGGAALDSLSDAAKTALTELQGEEKALAALDQDCDLRYVADVKTKVETELQAKP